MSTETFTLSKELHDYLLKVSLREHEVLRRIRAENAGSEHASLQIAPEQGQFMALLVRLLQARRIIEVGVYTGYSSLWMALALPPDGKIVACDVSEEWTRIARGHWQAAGVADRIDLRLAPALETMDALVEAGESGSYDMVFIDALKREYPDYYERALTLLRRGGLIAVDNTLWSGRVADPDNNEDLTVTIRDFNEHVAADERVEISLLPLGDGLTLAMKK